MNIHEFQGKSILKKYGVPVPRGGVATTPAAAVEVAKGLPADLYVVKSQIHAGGRGKGTVFTRGANGELKKTLQGGVQLAKSHKEVKEYSAAILGNLLVTHQSGKEGKVVNQVLVEEGMPIARELYLGAVLDRESSRVVIMISTEGGMDIEQVAEKSPEKIHKATIDPLLGLRSFQCRDLVYPLKLGDPEVEKNLIALLPDFFRCFTESDCSICEINPLVVLKDKRVVALDAKLNFDDNALFRHPEIEAMRDQSEENPLETEAHRFNLNYIKLDGSIGCMVNGAGLAMATMDIIKYAGGEPANFLDVGGGVSKEGVIQAFKIILRDENVRGIFINIFGGIARCDLIAQGVVDAAKEIRLSLPCVVRLEGTNVDLGRKILKESGLGFLMAQTMKEGAEKIVQAIQSGPAKKNPTRKGVKK